MIKIKDFYSQSEKFRSRYNCGGFALGTMTWFLFECFSNCDFIGKNKREIYKKMGKMTYKCALELLEKYPKQLRLIHNECEKKSYEEVFYFRLSEDGDFHFVVKNGNTYYHKKGGNVEVSKMTKKELFNIWEGGYNGPILMFAKTKKSLKDKEGEYYRDLCFD